MVPGLPWPSICVGETAICDADGVVLQRLVVRGRRRLDLRRRRRDRRPAPAGSDAARHRVTTVTARRRIVDGTYSQVMVPSICPPRYGVDPDVTVDPAERSGADPAAVGALRDHRRGQDRDRLDPVPARQRRRAGADPVDHAQRRLAPGPRRHAAGPRARQRRRDGAEHRRRRRDPRRVPAARAPGDRLPARRAQPAVEVALRDRGPPRARRSCAGWRTSSGSAAWSVIRPTRTPRRPSIPTRPTLGPTVVLDSSAARSARARASLFRAAGARPDASARAAGLRGATTSISPRASRRLRAGARGTATRAPRPSAPRSATASATPG